MISVALRLLNKDREPPAGFKYVRSGLDARDTRECGIVVGDVLRRAGAAEGGQRLALGVLGQS